MARESKSFLDLFLDTVTTPKKRGVYFGEEQEDAIVQFNSSATSEKVKLQLFEQVIEPAFRRIITGVLEMKKFHHLGKLNREDLIDNTFFRMVEKMDRFQPGRIGKTGQPVKAYSYFSTVAKNHILEQKLRNEKILKHKADVETSIDLSILSEETLEKMSNYDKQDVSFESYESVFDETKKKIINQIDLVIRTEESKDKPDKDLLKIGYYLKYLLKKWDKIEFMKKNEFMRILTLYVGLKQQQVSFLFKKFKIAVLDNINPSLINKNKIKKSKKASKKIEEDFENFDDCDDTYSEELEDIENESNGRFKYEIITMEDFEIETDLLENDKIKSKWKKKTILQEQNKS